ncbi:DEAD/DEAH box helicase [Bacillus tianshenii]|uniref:DEAD/DEAH box helicase n=1 Tax=Sutcliffiella tianshenii TaxID=1463404 RepID=UPI001CD7DC2E|nr:DEAD/DEAH box helicase [Bacillus tianshenii]MCA1318379.1 DEAD/DEAH box helicase [Bacillus tianshenii]
MGKMEIKSVFQQKPNILMSRVRLKGFYSDFYTNDFKKVNLLMLAYDSGVLETLKSSFPINEFDRNTLITKLIKQYSVVEDAAIWAIDTWVSAVDDQVLRELAEVEATQALDATHKVEELEKEAVKLFEASNHGISSEEDGYMDIIEDPIDFRDEYDTYYVNAKKINYLDRIYVPCGVGNSDYGFFICGINKVNKCNHPYANVYALVYNYLVRNSKIKNEDKPHLLKQEETLFDLDYKNVFRYSIILLQMVKNNRLKNETIEMNFFGVKDEMNLAVKMINHYSALFCRLIGIAPHNIKLVFNSNASTVGLASNKGIYIEENKDLVSNARELWIGQRINYRLTNGNLRDLEYILTEISPFDRFKEGQFEALKNMLSSKEHVVCIMPTGSGKSLIFYMASLLQPLPVFVVTPTDILIRDQIRNLQKFHHFDNVSHLRLTTDNDFRNYEMYNSLLFLTPTTFQNRNLLSRFRHINKDLQVAFIVLDEIHCLSNWGHDFRPEYLMLSKFLNKFLDRTTFLGFTATANYTVVEDIQKQLAIPQRNFFSPIAFDKYNISYDFRCVDSTDEMYGTISKILQELLRKNERTIIFTKKEEIALKVADAVGYEADVFLRSNPTAYHHFADGKCKVLVASEDLGVGINFPNVKNIIHFGLPVSKNEYVQEIGRAGRANEQVTSYIIYLNSSSKNVNPSLLKRNTGVEHISETINHLENDYADAFRKLNNNANSKEALYNQLFALYEKFRDDGRAHYVMPYAIETIETSRKHLYMLYVVGYVYDWYSYSANDKASTVNIFVDISSTNHHLYSMNENMINRMKEKASDYFDFMGSNRESIVKIARASSIEEIIKVYVDWYYTKYLYLHKEQFLDFVAFIEGNQEGDNEKITSEIKEYFTLPFIEIISDEEYYSNLTLKELTLKTLKGIGKHTIANIERINSNRYSYRLDFFLFLGGLQLNSRFDRNRLERILSHVSRDEFLELKDSLYSIFPKCKPEGRLSILKFLDSNDNSMGIAFLEFFNKVYEERDKDTIYYGVMAKYANIRFDSFRRT